MGGPRRQAHVSLAVQRQLTERFLVAARQGDLQRLEELEQDHSKLQDVRGFLVSDEMAISYQTLLQYRKAALEIIDRTEASD